MAAQNPVKSAAKRSASADPVASAAEAAATALGPRVASARKRAGLTLDGLARASGVSKATLSQIERNCANPSLTVLYRVAMALSVPVSQLLGEEGVQATLEVVEAGDPHRKMFTNQTCSGRLLNPAWLDKEWEFYELNFPKGGKLDSQPHHPGTREMLTVVEGRVRVSSGDPGACKQAELKPGDTAFYSADLPHCIENIGKEAAVVYLLVRYRDAR